MADRHLVTGIWPETGPKGIEDALCARPPGISSDSRYVGFFAQPHIVDHWADWIPEDQIQNYNDAIEAGRAVVTYEAEPAEAPQVEQALKDARIKNVKTFESTSQSAL